MDLLGISTLERCVHRQCIWTRVKLSAVSVPVTGHSGAMRIEERHKTYSCQWGLGLRAEQTNKGQSIHDRVREVISPNILMKFCHNVKSVWYGDKEGRWLRRALVNTEGSLFELYNLIPQVLETCPVREEWT